LSGLCPCTANESRPIKLMSGVQCLGTPHTPLPPSRTCHRKSRSVGSAILRGIELRWGQRCKEAVRRGSGAFESPCGSCGFELAYFDPFPAYLRRSFKITDLRSRAANTSLLVLLARETASSLLGPRLPSAKVRNKWLSITLKTVSCKSSCSTGRDGPVVLLFEYAKREI